jgi:hypothetical protein
MSATKSWSLWCDDRRCAGAGTYAVELHFDTLAQLRRQARRDGWVHRNGKDFCPDHAAPSTPEGDQAP